MRFSLGTLVLMVLFGSAAYAVWWFREPWYLAETLQISNSDRRFEKYVKENPWAFVISPDGKRKLGSLTRKDQFYFGLPSLAVYEISEPSPWRTNDKLLSRTTNLNDIGRFGPIEPDDRLIQALSSTRTIAFFESDDDVFLLSDTRERPGLNAKETTPLQHYKRRFVETRFGQFTRPEVWMAIVTFGLLIVQFVRHRKRNRIPGAGMMP